MGNKLSKSQKAFIETVPNFCFGRPAVIYKNPDRSQKIVVPKGPILAKDLKKLLS